MKKTLNNQNQQNIQLDLKKTTPMVCDNAECGNDMFMPAMKFRKVSKLLTGTQDDQVVPIQVYFCSACGKIPAGFDLDI
jgi:hypothetical protein